MNYCCDCKFCDAPGSEFAKCYHPENGTHYRGYKDNITGKVTKERVVFHLCSASRSHHGLQDCERYEPVPPSWLKRFITGKWNAFKNMMRG
jgi:hypothetical protein